MDEWCSLDQALPPRVWERAREVEASLFQEGAEPIELGNFLDFMLSRPSNVMGISA
jgi:hypothetical protein